jgi:hypothetical protein
MGERVKEVFSNAGFVTFISHYEVGSKTYMMDDFYLLRS